MSTGMSLPSRRAFHVVYESSLVDTLHYAAKNNWTGVVPDIGVPRFSPERFSNKDRDALSGLATTLGIEWGFHAPGDDISLFLTYPPIRSAVMSYFKEIIELARDLSEGKTNMVIHAGKPPSFRKAGAKEDEFADENLDDYESAFLENVVELVEYGAPDVKIALENHGWTPLVRHSIPSLLARGLRLCLDVPKLYGSSNELNRSDWRVFQQFSSSIEVVHLHDTVPGLGSHQVVGTGAIDFSTALDFLSGLKHAPQYVFEVRPRGAATESLQKVQQILTHLGSTLL
jgi:sugar phosphate isomerase/epimerase